LNEPNYIKFVEDAGHLRRLSKFLLIFRQLLHFETRATYTAVEVKFRTFEAKFRIS